MTREEVKNEILKANKKYILAQLPTGMGKSKIALDWVNHFKNSEIKSILIVIPRLVLIDNWKDEFKKWGYKHLLNKVTFVTYVSFPKKADAWDLVIFDEAHHLSQRCIEALSEYKIRYCIMLSASISKEIKIRLQTAFKNLWIYKVTTKEAINNGILPDPKVYLIPLTLDNTQNNCTIVKNPSQKNQIIIPYKDRWKYTNIKNSKIVITCTQKQFYDDLSSLILWYKNRSFKELFKNLFLKKSGDRLKWLSEQKVDCVKNILKVLSNQRTLTFCNGIKQTELLGKYCINSKNKKSQDNLNKFNEGLINHITACNILDEGVNLVNCRIGIYAVLNSSDRMIKQKLGRLLRHPNPIIIIPYFKNTREEEIVNKMVLENYNTSLITIVNNIKDIKL